MTKGLKKLLQQYYEIKTQYKLAVCDYIQAKHIVRYWLPFDNQNDKLFLLQKAYKRDCSFNQKEVKEVAKKYNKELYGEYDKKEVYEHRVESQERCANCKKRVKELNGQLQVICELIDNRILSKKLKKRYEQLRRYYDKSRTCTKN